MSLPDTLWLPNTTRHPIPRLDHGPLATVRYVVIHINEGTTAGTLSWWAQPGHEADGAHLQISKDGRAYQTAALNRKLWHAGAANGESVGFEHEGFSHATHPKDTRPHVQLHASANRLAWVLHECQLGRPKHGKNYFGHGEGGAAWGGHPDCPGSWPWAEYQAMAMTAYMEHWGR